MVKDLAYFVQPESPGPGVLFLHSLWGLTSSVRKKCDRLADLGYTTLAPDLNQGELPESEADALARLGEASPDRLASLVLSSAHLLSEKAASDEISVVGFGMGGSLGLWASVRLSDVISSTVSFYGTQQIDFAGARSSYLLHLAEKDEFITDDEAAFMEATMGLEALQVEVVRYPGTSHGFCDPEGADFDAAMCEEAWERTISFLARGSGRGSAS